MQSFQIKTHRAGHVIVILAVLLLMSITYWAFFIKENPAKFDTTGIIIFSLMSIIGSTCLFMAIRTLVQNKPVITISSEGFEYNPGGVSSGFMYWNNVAELKFVGMRTTQVDVPGLIYEQALAIKLKDPSLYSKKFNPLLRGLMRLNYRMYDADIFFRLSSFGKQSEEVCRLMNQYWKESQMQTVNN